jgi:Exopolyphosphatase-related proteins
MLLADVVKNLKHSNNMKVVWTVITQSKLKDIGATENDIDGITEYIRSIKDVEISFMILELSSGAFRINFRSSGNFSVNDIAEKFNGGGHKFAAGARLDENYNITDIESSIIDKINIKIPGEINVN